MSKAQFLELLSEKLSEELSRADVMVHLNYYEGYINGEIEKGRSEEAVMEELGDPFMIARTILDTQSGEAFETSYTQETVYTEPAEQEYQEQDRKAGKTIVMGNIGCLLTAVLLILIGVGIISVLTGIIATLLPVLLPVLVILIVLFMVKGRQR